MSVGYKGGDSIKPLLAQLSTKSPAPVASTPVPTTASSADSPPSADPSDWSSHAPRRVSERPVAVMNPTLASVPVGKPAYNPVRIDTALSTNAVPPSPLYSPAVPRPPSVSQSSPLSSSPQHRRSVSAMSFASPRSTEVTPAKRMKQLALLESVVDESARMTPTLEHMSRMQQQPSLPMMNGHGPMLRPATSGPMQGMFPSFPQQSLLYSSGMGNPPPARIPSVPLSAGLPPLSSVVADDPFTVRPRNGEMPVPHHMHARVRQSMNETQLAPMLQRPCGNLQGPPPQGPYLPPAPVYASHYPPHFQGRVPPMPMVTPSHLPIPRAFTPGPMPAPQMAPPFEGHPGPHHPPHNNQLLSILNANGPNRHPMSSMITPVGVVNGIEHR
jgi:mRNA-decapping enzyme subunit 2